MRYASCGARCRHEGREQPPVRRVLWQILRMPLHPEQERTGIDGLDRLHDTAGLARGDTQTAAEPGRVDCLAVQCVHATAFLADDRMQAGLRFNGDGFSRQDAAYRR